MAGRSGAAFVVLKFGDDPEVIRRLHAQRKWLADHQGPGVAELDDRNDPSGYFLELLEPLDNPMAAYRLLLIGRILESRVWCNKIEGHAAWSEHLAVIASRGAPDWLVQLGRDIGPPTELCDTHGDATAENIMWSLTRRQEVLIDPITDASCGHWERASDLGKMLQSAVGYGYGASLEPNRKAIDVVRSFARSAREWQRARYWLGVWLVMIRKYQESDYARQLTNDLERLRSFIEGTPLAFLDRDGTLNRTAGGVPPRGDDPVTLIEGALSACRRLISRGFGIVIVTNQPEVARGTLTHEDVERVNRIVAGQVGAVATYACPHERGTCGCRKPEVASLEHAALRYDADLRRSWMIGDKETDVECGQRFGISTALVKPDSAFALANVVNERVLA